MSEFGLDRRRCFKPRYFSRREAEQAIRSRLSTKVLEPQVCWKCSQREGRGIWHLERRDVHGLSDQEDTG